MILFYIKKSVDTSYSLLQVWLDGYILCGQLKKGCGVFLTSVVVELLLLLLLLTLKCFPCRLFSLLLVVVIATIFFEKRTEMLAS